jgi:YfiH family protein
MKYVKPHWPAPSHIKACTTLRDVWCPEESGDHDTHYPKTLLKSLLALPSDPIWIKQTHSTIAIEAIPENKDKNADASFTHQAHHICAVLTADCLPLLICNKSGTKVAAIHAGWRGLANGIIETTLAAIKEPADDLLVWLGPAIGPQKFEVGKDVFDAFMNHDTNAMTAFTPHIEGKWFANLYNLAKMRLQAKGVSAIYGGDFCTYSQDDLFFSYRRDKGKTGRMVSLIWIDTVG